MLKTQYISAKELTEHLKSGIKFDGKVEATINPCPYKGIEQLPSENPLDVFSGAGYPETIENTWRKAIHLNEFDIFDRLNEEITEQEKSTSSRRREGSEEKRER